MKTHEIIARSVPLQTVAGPVYVLRLIGLPPALGGFSVPFHDGALIVINAERDEQEQAKTFLHEIVHVLRGHLVKTDRAER